ncbi:MAG: hypothetical protein QW570_07525 [Candidatus Caldarchaeum sp.]
MSVKAGMVVTTIYDLEVMESYFDNFLKNGRLDQVQVFVIPDRKTPKQAYERCRDLHQRGMDICCPAIEEQEDFLTKVGFPPSLIPYDSDNRRNVGFLMALERGVDFVISIDDDNFCSLSEDFFSEHMVVCRNDFESTVVSSPNNWFNICSLIRVNHECPIYPRGFPYYARHIQTEFTLRQSQVQVHINEGLWLGDPDLDAITWLVLPTRALEFKGVSLVLDRNTWSPINTQNTALRREAVAAYYFVKMGYPLAGMPNIDRYGDIFSGYFVQACAKHLGGSIRVGSPILEHRRNTHHYLRDAMQEWACIIVLEDLIPAIMELRLEGSTYPEVYTSLSYALEETVERMKGSIWTDATRGYFHQVAYYMRLWAKVAAQFL